MSEKSSAKLNLEKMEKLLSAEGPLASIFSGFEERPGQLELLKSICKCFNERAIGVFEAGTGIGKSLAYLLPGIMWAFSNDTRIVISTSTINLQQQLIEKDAPLAIKILGFKEEDCKKIVLVKGRRNYLCLRRFWKFGGQGELFESEANTSMVIKNIIQMISSEGFNGEREQLDFFPSPQVWSSICSEADNCLQNRCQHFEACYYYMAKKKCDSARVLIANHHLLFSDLQAKNQNQNFDVAAVLPPFKNVVLDESHGIEDAARSGFSSEVNVLFLKKQLNSLYRASKQRSKNTGVLQEVSAISQRSDIFPETVKLITDTFEASTVLETCAFGLVPQESTWSFLQSSFQDKEQISFAISGFLKPLCDLNKNIFTILQNIPEEEDERDNEEKDLIHEANVLLSRLREVETFFQGFLRGEEDPETIFWFEKINDSFGSHIQFYSTPLNLERFMQSALFSPQDSVICTSATLQISNSFNFFLDTMGLKTFTEKKIYTNTFNSPFPYKENVLFSIPTDIPLPIESDFSGFVMESVLPLILASQGRSLILFTSYSMLRDVYEHTKAKLEDSDITLFYQGQYDRTKLLHCFKEDISSCLFATESFWTGVDIPGEALSHVILVKLPFDVPTHPIVFAKSKRIEVNGGKPFFELSVPNAVIKFKQGFGRLMRSKSDVGAITVLDSRLIKKNYGAFFLSSIPESKKAFATFKNILYNIEDFFASKG